MKHDAPGPPFPPASGPGAECAPDADAPRGPRQYRAMKADRPKIDLRTIVTALQLDNRPIYVTNGTELAQVVGVGAHGLFVLEDCKDTRYEPQTKTVTAVRLALEYRLVNPDDARPAGKMD